MDQCNISAAQVRCLFAKINYLELAVVRLEAQLDRQSREGPLRPTFTPASSDICDNCGHSKGVHLRGFVCPDTVHDVKSSGSREGPRR